MRFFDPIRLLACLVAVILLAPAARGADPIPAGPLRVCILSGCPTYNSEKSLPPFQKWLETNYQVTAQRVVRKDDELQGLAKLDECDVALIFFKRMNLKGEQLERFQKYVKSGRPIVGVRTASHAVQTWLAFDREVLGGNYTGHYGKEPVEIQVTDAGKKHPILAGVELTAAAGPLYKNTGHAKDITLLLTGTIPGHTEPLAWTRDYKGGRIFYTSLGDEKTFEEEAFRQMLAQSLFWTAKREVSRKTSSR
jgi:type 1 glutamine amidotransferase